MDNKKQPNREDSNDFIEEIEELKQRIANAETSEELKQISEELKQENAILDKKLERKKKKLLNRMVDDFEQNQSQKKLRERSELRTMTFKALRENRLKGRQLTSQQREFLDTMLLSLEKADTFEMEWQMFQRETGMEAEIIRAVIEREKHQENIKAFMQTFLSQESNVNSSS